MRHWTDERTRRLARTGLLFALCCAFSAAESALTGWVGLPPGIKPGLANVVVMYTLFFLGGRPAAALVLLKAAFGAATRGPAAGFLSLCGGGLALAVLWLLEKADHRRLNWAALSVCGALAHNLGQLAGIGFWMGSAAVLYYLPVLVLAAVGCGLLSAAVLRLVSAALTRTGAEEHADAAKNHGTQGADAAEGGGGLGAAKGHDVQSTETAKGTGAQGADTAESSGAQRTGTAAAGGGANGTDRSTGGGAGKSLAATRAHGADSAR